MLFLGGLRWYLNCWGWLYTTLWHCVVSSSPLTNISSCPDASLNPSDSCRFYRRCTVLSSLSFRCPGSLFLNPSCWGASPPPLLGTSGSIFAIVVSVAYFGFSSRKMWLGPPHLSDRPLSLQLLPPFSWSSPSLCLGVTGTPRGFR